MINIKIIVSTANGVINKRAAFSYFEKIGVKPREMYSLDYNKESFIALLKQYPELKSGDFKINYRVYKKYGINPFSEDICTRSGIVRESLRSKFFLMEHLK